VGVLHAIVTGDVWGLAVVGLAILIQDGGANPALAVLWLKPVVSGMAKVRGMIDEEGLVLFLLAFYEVKGEA